jgi:cell division protein FtsZ
MGLDIILNEDFRPKIKVIGVGGGGGNAVNYMYNLGIEGVDFVVCNTDAQFLRNSPVPRKIILGETGLGAGNIPENGLDAAKKSEDDIKQLFEDERTDMVFLSVAMGGGTGTGASPYIAKIAKDKGILTVGIVSVPMKFEGKKRLNYAFKGLRALRDCVDAILIANSENLFDEDGEIKLSEGHAKIDKVMATATKGIAEVVTRHGVVNVDMKDVETTLKNSGYVIIGMGTSKGENRASEAIEKAFDSPLMYKPQLKSATKVLMNISYHPNSEITTKELGVVTNYLDEELGDTDYIWGSTGNDTLEEGELSVLLVVTGFESEDDMKDLDLDNPENYCKYLEKYYGCSVNSAPAPADDVVVNLDDDDMFDNPLDLDNLEFDDDDDGRVGILI